MKISKGFIKTAFRITEKATGKKYDCFLQDYQYIGGKSDGKHETRYNIGINGWNGWNFLWYVDEESFNKEYVVD